MKESIEDQEKNCELEVEKMDDFSIPLRIKFNKDNPQWKICRIAINVKFDKFAISYKPKSIENFDSTKKYRYYRC